MPYARLTLWVALSLVAFCLCACNPITAPTPAPPATAATGASTEVILFAPDSIAPAPDQQPVPGTCAPSSLLPRPGAFRCTTAAGAIFDPCFALSAGALLGCDPNPVAGTYAALVTPNEPLPATTGESDPLPFYVNLGPSKPLCAIGPDTPKELLGQPVTFACQAPGAWIVGPLQMQQPTWLADYTVTDSAGTEVTYGPEASAVVQAWVY